MLITRTPLRLSFFCGGSDLPAFYRQEEGAALSITIDKYIYVMAHKTPHIGIRTMYDTIEEVDDIDSMQHIISKETLKYFNISKEITVASISDILAKGSGLGSSSAFTVGLVNALSSFKWEIESKKYIADVACEIEMDKCGYPVGKQDQYASAYGGLNHFTFEKDGNVLINNINIPKTTLSVLQDRLLLLYSGRGRKANTILQKQQHAMLDKEKFQAVVRARDKVFKGLDYLYKSQLDQFGELFHQSWIEKKNLVSSITDDYFDSIYNFAKTNKAVGGKLLGAGGGGFFIFYTYNPRELGEKIVQEFPECKAYDFKFTYEGSQLMSLDNN